MSAKGTAGPSDELLDELDASTMMLGRLMAARHGHFCEDMPVSPPQLMVLLVLAHSGPTKAGDLATPLGIKAPATTSLLDSLERDGFVTREHAADDRRVTLVSLTEAGEAVLAVAKERRREHMRALLGTLSTDDIRALIRIQRQIVGAMVDQSA
ncbi:MAG TPA: MarR family transcriptional regulator [Coriobacteriia bacterium]|nr:MarR family transcriptional regulator [Coriobacteriia bacterium]